MVTAPARRELVRWMQTRGLSERRCLQVVRMSASSLWYEPRPDRNQEVRERIIALAQRHRRYGVGMIHFKLRQAGGEPINYKRVERINQLEKLHIRRRRRGVHRQSDVNVGSPSRGHVEIDRTRQAKSERIRRVVQRAISG
jgi:putative transposase